MFWVTDNRETTDAKCIYSESKMVCLDVTQKHLVPRSCGFSCPSLPGFISEKISYTY